MVIRGKREGAAIQVKVALSLADDMSGGVSR